MENHDPFLDDKTGSDLRVTRVIQVPFERYVITVRVGPSGEFIDILEVAVKKDFLSPEQKMHSIGYHDVADLY
jgi:hypothetical protein